MTCFVFHSMMSLFGNVNLNIFTTKYKFCLPSSYVYKRQSMEKQETFQNNLLEYLSMPRE